MPRHLVSTSAFKKSHAAGRTLPKTRRAVERISSERTGSSTARVEPRLLLIHLLREELGITGPHIGCDTSHA